MGRKSKQHPSDPMDPGASFIYDPELATPEPPEHITAMPEHEVSKLYAAFLKVEALYAHVLAAGLVFSS